MELTLILVPYDSAHRGTRMGAGPEALVAAGLPAHLERAGHRVRVEPIELPDDVWRAEIASAFLLARSIAERVRAARAEGAFPIVLAGNCMSTVGVVGGLEGGDADLAIAWLDAHGDFNTPDTTVGGFLDGMALATVVGRCWPQLVRAVPGFAPVPEHRVWLLGARDLDPLEEAALRDSGVRHVRAGAVGERAAVALAGRAATDGWRQLYVHLDLDVLDPGEGLANALAAPRGPSLDAVLETLRALGERAAVVALTLSAYDPTFDDDGRVARAAMAAAESLLAPLGRG